MVVRLTHRAKKKEEEKEEENISTRNDTPTTNKHLQQHMVVDPVFEGQQSTNTVVLLGRRGQK
tara:strand:+ start:434 stop:622 length:189 start_codon:yes stop_codon:yes gene_type:complete